MYKSVLLVTIFATSLCECFEILEKMKSLVEVEDPDMHRNVTEMITSKGYPAEYYTVQTADGYLLGVQRIPYDKNETWKGVKNRPVLFLQHGLLSAASDWVLNFPNQSLGFLAADEGYDVWLGNVRGNTYSRHHITLSPDQHEFWDYSFDEMAKYDLPAMIDFVLNATGRENLFYVGHSQGTCALFALLSERPEFNIKINMFIALAPVTTVGHLKSAIRAISPFAYQIKKLTTLLGGDEVLPARGPTELIKELLCTTPLKSSCEQIIFLLFGYDKEQLNETRIGVYAAHTPAGSSIKSIAHFGQMINSGLFAKYDYRSEGNMEHYNQTNPPEYDVTRITTPVALIWARNDDLADPTDVGYLYHKLKGKSLVASYRVPFPDFNHGDFVYGLDAFQLVYKKVFEWLKEAQNQQRNRMSR